MPELTPAEILARAREVYATCRTYRDEGVVVTRTVHLDAAHRHTSRKPFWTDFVRPDRFRFEWAEATVGDEREWRRHLILMDERGVRANGCGQEELCEVDGVHRAIAGATGVSGGSAYTVPTLLLPGGSGRDPLPASESVTPCGRQRVDGHECFGLEHAHREGGKQVLWIGCTDFLLRRIDQEQVFDERVFAQLRKTMEEHAKAASTDEQRRISASALEHFERTKVPPFRTETVTSYEPVVDASIERERFGEPAAWARSDVELEVPPSARLVLEGAEPDAPSAAELLARVRHVYGNCARLRDRGTQTRVRVPRRASLPTKKQTFELAFVRPDRFRLVTAEVSVASEEEWERTLYLWNDEVIRANIRYLPGGKKLFASGNELLGSFSIAIVAAALLVPVVNERDPLPQRDVSLLGLAEHEGRACYVVHGLCWNDTKRTLWIDRERSCILRCDDVHEFDAAWNAKMRAQSEERLRQALSPEERAACEHALEMFSKPAEPYRTEITQLFAPEFDVELAPELFATPAGWD